MVRSNVAVATGPRHVRRRGKVPRHGLSATILRGASWSTLSQLTPLVVNIALTPVVIRGFGVERYGLFLVCSTFVTFIASFDGGIGQSASRFLAVAVGEGDERTIGRLVASLTVAITVVGCSLFAIIFCLSGPVVGFFGGPPAFRAEAVYLIRVLAVVVAVSQMRSILGALLGAHQRYAWQSVTGLFGFAIYAVGVLVTLHFNWGLRGLAWTYLIQAGVVTMLTAGRALSFFNWRTLGLWDRPEYVYFLQYSAKVQFNALMSIFNTQADTFLVGRVLSVRSVAIFGTGASLAFQVRQLPLNLLGPMAVALARCYGEGDQAAFSRLFAKLQTRWVQLSTGWCAVGVGAVYFGVPAWLGSDFRRSGEIATILLLAHGVNLWTGTLTSLLSVVGRPGLELRYAIVTVALNIGLTVPLLLAVGILGTVLATAIGNVVGSLYLVRIAKRHYDASLPSFLSDVPWAAAVVTIACVTGLELISRPILPHGVLGLIGCALVATPGFAVYGLIAFGPSASLRAIRRGASWVRS